MDRMSRAGVLLLIAALLIYSAGDLWQNIAWPPFFSFDETLEIDYVYQLTQGHLPTFFGGAEFNPLNLTYPYDVQWRYQHPPLFYALEVPVFLLFDTLRHPIRGIWAMRILVWVMGVLLIVASRWTAKWIIGHENMAVCLVPVIVAANRCLPSVVFNYTLASLWVTLLIGMSAKLVRTMSPPERQSQPGTLRTVVAWWLIVILAPLTRLSTVPIMGLCLLIVFLAACWMGHAGRTGLSGRTRNNSVRIRNILVLCLLPGLAAVLSSAWFYLRLHALSGNFTGSQPEWSRTHLQRDTHKSFIASLLDPHFYKSTMSQYQNSAVTNTGYGWAFVLLLTIIPMLIGFIALIVWVIRQWREQRPTDDTGRPATLIALMLILAFGGTVFQQLLFYMQGGSDNAVYFSLISIVFAIVIAVGFTEPAYLLPHWMMNSVIVIWLALKLAALLLEAKLKWPFAVGGAMEHAGTVMQMGAWSALAVSVIGVLLAVITVCLCSWPSTGCSESE